MPGSDKRLEQQITEIAQLAKENKEVDAAALMLQALQTHERNLLPASQKRLAYVVSLAAPPFGLLFAAKFWFSGADDSEQVAYTCIALTVVALVLVWLFAQSLVSGSGVDRAQLEQLTPQDVLQVVQ
ncbi:MAG: hypothetical protein KBD66_00605 [Candidatus Doudnabacteria bacterium]|nr:hypothetical protein [Candidatus Doudnabacteria bacterium]